jgi:hypothetical protein
MKRVLIAALIAIVPTVAFGQTKVPEDDIVVRDRREADRKAVERFVGEISVRTDTQLARFHQPVCPAVIGLPRDYAMIVEKRIVADALAAGMTIDRKAKCAPNLIVVIAESGSALVADIRRRRSGWLEGLAPAEVDALIAPAPARAWSVTSLRNEDGRGLGKTPEEAGANPLAGVPTLRVMSASIIREPTRQDMEASFVVIDEAATVGLSLRQIADYAAMRGLAHTRPPAPGGAVDTILSVLDGAPSPPRSLTAADASFLRALYASQGLATAVSERNAITRRIAKGK